MELDHDLNDTYHCRGCGGTTDSRMAMERHEAGCVLALRTAMADLTAEMKRLAARITALETEKREREEAAERAGQFEDFRAEYRHRREQHEGRWAAPVDEGW